jgi:hypothetical protein
MEPSALSTRPNARLDYELGKRVLRYIGEEHLDGILGSGVASLAVSAMFGDLGLKSARAVRELDRVRREIEKKPFDEELQVKLARVLALFGVEVPIRSAMKKRFDRREARNAEAPKDLKGRLTERQSLPAGPADDEPLLTPVSRTPSLKISTRRVFG